MSLFVLGVIWIAIGGVVGYFAPNIFKGERPYGLNGDLLIGIITMIVIGLGDWYLVPLILPNITRLFLFLAALLEPLVGAILVLWLVRYLKRR